MIAAGSLLNALAFGVFAVLGWLPADLSVSPAPEHLRGPYLAVYQLSWTFGQTVAPLLLTVPLDRGASLPWLFLTVLALLAVPALLLLERMTGVETGAIDGIETAARAGGVRPEPVG